MTRPAPPANHPLSQPTLYILLAGVLCALLFARPAPAESPPPGASREFKTDFGKHSVPYGEILSGGPPRDGIPSIDTPGFVSVEQADRWLEDREPIVLFEFDGDARAYPIQILMWHELVNDTVGGIPVTISFCPLCNTAIVFDGRLDDRRLTFGTTGRLRYSNLIMYDRQTETWWQQATGEAIVGELLGHKLTTLPAAIISWQTFKTTCPGGTVLSRDTGHARDYGRNPYLGYDDIRKSPFLYRGPDTDGRLPPMARVITVDLHGRAVAYPYDILEKQRVINDTVGKTPIAAFWKKGAASALDAASVSGGRDVGAVATYSRELDGNTLTFISENGRILDERTRSEWTLLGEAIGGPHRGRRLSPIVHINHFWFSWAAFRPETHVYRP